MSQQVRLHFLQFLTPEQRPLRLALWDHRGLQVSESTIVGSLQAFRIPIHNQNYANKFIRWL